MPEGNTCPHCQKPLPETPPQKAAQKLTKEDYTALADNLVLKPSFLMILAVMAVIGVFVLNAVISKKLENQLLALDQQVQDRISASSNAVQKSIEAQFALPQFSNVVVQVAEKRAKHLLDAQIFPVIQGFGSNVAVAFQEFKRSGETNIAELSATTELAVLILRAQSDDAKAFDQLADMRQTNETAAIAVGNLLNQLQSDRIRDGLIGYSAEDDPWSGTGIDPDKATIEEHHSRLFSRISYFERIGLMNRLDRSPRFTEEDKLNFLVRTMTTTVSLRVRSHACMLINGYAKLNKTVLFWPLYRDWYHQRVKERQK